MKRSWPHVLLLPIAAAMLLPSVWLVVSSFKAEGDFFGSILFPRDEAGRIALDRLTLDNFVRLFDEVGLGVAMVNSFLLSSTLAVGSSLACAACGYALARLRFSGAGAITGLTLALLVVPTPLLLAPTYELLYHLGLLDQYVAVLLPSLVPAFGVFLFRQACLRSVPVELLEAARLDGVGEVGIFFSIVMPLLRPMLGAFVLITFLATWNNFLVPQIVLQSPEKMPLAVAVANMKGVYYQDYGMQMAATLVSVVPVAGLFFLLERDFVAGLTAGAIRR